MKSTGSIGNLIRVTKAVLYELQPCRYKDLRRFFGGLSRTLKDLSLLLYDTTQELTAGLILFTRNLTLQAYLEMFLWVSVFLLCKYLQIEHIGVTLSLLYLLLRNLRERGKDDDELSAYSVFNKGMRRLMGTLTAEQFENEIMHGQRAQPPPRENFNDQNNNDINALGADEGRRVLRGKKARRTYEARLERRRQAEALAGEFDGN